MKLEHGETATKGICAIVLAGSRPGRDPMADAAGVPLKALVPVAGETMLSRVARTLLTHREIGGVLILAQDTELLSRSSGDALWQADPRVQFIASGSGISSSLAAALGKDAYPALVTTADNVLLTHAMIDSFIEGATKADVAVGMVERRVLLDRYPASRRTWLKFRKGWWSGANLFWFANDKVQPLLSLWQSVEQDRKKGMKIVGAFGPMLLLGAAFRVLTIHRAAAMAGRRLGLNARIVSMPQPEACIDIDKPADLAMAEAILHQRLPV
ncbi:NTP transferase domain-containing protein [Rhizorhapis suberifaciens]|uniref:GTP:adenosylcobinamide-phosphate guanylyltransferase n=1 Tax=Rhizorhapis suberifaciens TaxID=13656 RepID=A0A840HUG5_9SPHN|nr:NTP transferase domain-containing protein [Rhizorhapis suberifaciens]MBB4641114.1 GTP:adenosylcobinamide-phosphate guanylyltransferase [Rhizorhapis suberifaciens]